MAFLNFHVARDLYELAHGEGSMPPTPEGVPEEYFILMMDSEFKSLTADGGFIHPYLMALLDEANIEYQRASNADKVKIESASMDFRPLEESRFRVLTPAIQAMSSLGNFVRPQPTPQGSPFAFTFNNDTSPSDSYAADVEDNAYTVLHHELWYKIPFRAGKPSARQYLASAVRFIAYAPYIPAMERSTEFWRDNISFVPFLIDAAVKHTREGQRIAKEMR
jgi:hypothetical protein